MVLFRRIRGVLQCQKSGPSRSKQPTPARSVATFANILDAATAIILERGVKGLNTNLVAQRAGVNVGTVYHYFPHKTAILIELFRTDLARRSADIFEKLDELPGVEDLEAWTAELGELVRRLRDDHPATMQLRRAFQSIPELVEMDAVETGRLAEHLAQLLQRRFATVDPRRAHAISHLLIETTVSILDSPMARGPGNAGLLRRGGSDGGDLRAQPRALVTQNPRTPS